VLARRDPRAARQAAHAQRAQPVATAKAIDYSLERRPALTPFLDDGELPKE
jgi:hypothetical protein